MALQPLLLLVIFYLFTSRGKLLTYDYFTTVCCVMTDSSDKAMSQVLAGLSCTLNDITRKMNSMKDPKYKKKLKSGSFATDSPPLSPMRQRDGSMSFFASSLSPRHVTRPNLQSSLYSGSSCSDVRKGTKPVIGGAASANARKNPLSGRRPLPGHRRIPQQQQQNSLRNLYASISNMVSSLSGSFLPDSPFRRVLHFLLLCVIFFDFIDGTQLLSSQGWWKHNYPDDFTTEYTLYLCIGTVISFTESILSFRTAILKGWALIDSDLEKIKENYLKTWFVFDAVTGFPSDLIALHFNSTAFKVCRAVKIVRIIRIPTLFRVSSPLSEKSRLVIAVLWTFGIAIIVHVFAVLWLLIGDRQKISQPGADITSALYFTVTTLTSVGYGDITPATVPGRIFVMFLQSFGMAVSIYLGSVGTAFFLEADPFKLAIKDRRKRLAAMMNNRCIPWELQKQCFTILPSVLESSIKDYSIILEQLPPYMQDKIDICIKERLLRSVPMFSGLTEATISMLLSQLLSVQVESRRQLISYGDAGYEMYFLSRGCVEVTIPSDKGEKWISTLKEGSWFGEGALLENTYRTANVRAITGIEVYILTRDAFLDIVEVSHELQVRVRGEGASALKSDFEQLFQEHKPRKGTISVDGSMNSGSTNSVK